MQINDEQVKSDYSKLAAEHAKTMRQLSKALQALKTQDYIVSDDVSEIMYEFSNLQETIRNLDSVEDVKTMVQMCNYAIWNIFAKKFGFASVEELQQKGFNLTYEASPRFSLKYTMQLDKEATPDAIPHPSTQLNLG